MLYGIMEFLVCLFAAYGVYTLVSCIAGAIRGRSLPDTPKVRVVVAVRDVEEYIENIVRNAAKMELPARLMSDGNLVFVDMGSQDGTLELLSMLKKDYEYIDILEMKDSSMAFSGFGK